MPIWGTEGRPSADQVRQREGMENLLRSVSNERQNRPEGTQASAQGQERGADNAQTALVPEGGVGTGRNGEPGRPEGAIANATTERTRVQKVTESRTFKNPHERFCDLEQQCEGLRYELGRMREELQRIIQFLHPQEFLDRNPRTRVDAERERYEHQREVMQYMTTSQAGRF